MTEAHTNTDDHTAQRRKRLVVLGGSVLQLPAVLRGQALGHEVIVFDWDPRCRCADIADHLEVVSTYDIDAVTEAARRLQADGIIAVATDWPMRSVAHAAQTLGLPAISWDAVVTCTDKGVMSEAFARGGVPHPQTQLLAADDTASAGHASAKQLPAGWSFPVIVKPTDSSGSRGVTLAADSAELCDAINAARSIAKSGTVLLQQYAQGPEVSVEGFVHNGTVHVLGITDKVTTGAPEFVEVGHSQPTQLSLEIQQEIEQVARRAVAAVGITMGAFHAEMIVTPTGPTLLEIGARMGGDFITTHLLPAATGISLTDLVIEQALSNDIEIPDPILQHACIRFRPAEEAVVASLEGRDAALSMPGVVAVEWMTTEGNEFGPVSDSTQRVAAVIAIGNTHNDAAKNAEAALACLKVHYDTPCGDASGTCPADAQSES